MKLQTIVAIALLVLGGLALTYGGFTYTSDRHSAELGSVELSINEESHISVPVWLGVVAMATGSALLLWPRRS